MKKLIEKYRKFRDKISRKKLLAESMQAHLWNKIAKTDHSVEEWKAILKKRYENKLKKNNQ